MSFHLIGRVRWQMASCVEKPKKMAWIEFIILRIWLGFRAFIQVRIVCFPTHRVGVRNALFQFAFARECFQNRSCESFAPQTQISLKSLLKHLDLMFALPSDLNIFQPSSFFLLLLSEPDLYKKNTHTQAAYKNTDARVGRGGTRCRTNLSRWHLFSLPSCTNWGDVSAACAALCGILDLQSVRQKAWRPETSPKMPKTLRGMCAGQQRKHGNAALEHNTLPQCSIFCAHAQFSALIHNIAHYISFYSYTPQQRSVSSGLKYHCVLDNTWKEKQIVFVVAHIVVK